MTDRFWTEIDRDINHPGLYTARLMLDGPRQSVITYKDGLTLPELNRWCKRKLLGLDEAEAAYEPDELGSASQTIRGWENDRMRELAGLDG